MGRSSRVRASVARVLPSRVGPVAAAPVLAGSRPGRAGWLVRSALVALLVVVAALFAGSPGLLPSVGQIGQVGRVAAAGCELIPNGSFEDPPQPMNIQGIQSSVDGWGGFGTAQLTADQTAFDGRQMLQNLTGRITRDIPTTGLVGETLVLRFTYEVRSGPLNVLFGGQWQTFTATTPTSVRLEYTVVANDPSRLVLIFDAGEIHLDAVSLTVPSCPSNAPAAPVIVGADDLFISLPDGSTRTLVVHVTDEDSPLWGMNWSLVTEPGFPPAPVRVVHGLDGTGLFTWMSSAPDNRPVEYPILTSFRIAVTDGDNTTTAQVRVRITPPDAVPGARDDTLPASAEDTSRTISVADLLANDSPGTGDDADGTGLTFLEVSDATGGSVTRTDAGIVFTAAPNYHGPAGFTYTVANVWDETDRARVSFDITPVNDPPVAVADTLDAIAEDSGPRTIPFTDLTGNDSAGPNETGQTLTVTGVANPTGGTVAIVAGAVVFTPAPNVSGPAGFDYTVTDNGDPALSATARASFAITSVPDPFVIAPDPITITVAEDAGPATVSVTATSPDRPGGFEIYRTANPPAAFGTLASNGGFPPVSTSGGLSYRFDLTFTPAADATGTFAMGYRVLFRLGNGTEVVTLVPMTITITPVNDPPVLVGVPADITDAEATSAAGGPATFTPPTATDVDGDTVDTPTVTCTAPIGPDEAVLPVVPNETVFPFGPTTVTCTADDGSGADNATASDTFTVTVADTTAPVVTVPDDITEEAAAADGSSIDFDVTATDAVDESPDIACTVDGELVVSGATFPIATATVTCTATDAEGNTSADSRFTVTVQDSAGPVVDPSTLPGTGTPPVLTVEATGPTTTVSWAVVTATDAVDGSSAATCLPASGSPFALGDAIVSCTGTDTRGTTGPAATFTVRIVDTTAPVVTVPEDITAEATTADGAVVTFMATASIWSPARWTWTARSMECPSPRRPGSGWARRRSSARRPIPRAIPAIRPPSRSPLRTPSRRS